ncbi:DUF5681 domain-containing protein [Aestuariivirga sp.]|uniref:DUF5681 domain-containing protein n=1 Tax=Aestuariivirga sp. TaxID=2650926 RepID=UPI0039E64277
MMPDPAEAKQDSRFQPGQSGNPAGRPSGSRNKATLAAEKLLDGETEALTRKAVEMALEGDGQALRLCLERILPPRKSRPIRLDIGNISGVESLVAASAKVLEALGSGDITPDEARDVSAVIENVGAAIERRELEQRIARLEAESGK